MTERAEGVFNACLMHREKEEADSAGMFITTGGKKYEMLR